MPKSKVRKKARQKTLPKGKPVALCHDMAVYENFERCAPRLFEIIYKAQQTAPAAPRKLYFSVQGHRNSEDGYDHDAWEMLKHFLPERVLPYLTELSTPLYTIRNPRRQDNLVPQALHLGYPDGEEKSFWYDIDSLPLRIRETEENSRKTPPSKQSIMDYLGIDEECLICWGSPVERAHVVPTSLGGSMDVRNFALLCVDHHRQAPDIADAEAFWAWVDYAELRDSGSKWQKAPDELKRWVEASGGRVEPVDRSDQAFQAAVEFELRHLYRWSDEDFAKVSWAFLEEYHHVLDRATGRHFGVERKVATHAWAYHVAMLRLSRS
ncbi:HNH endonuclease signature motif containing protein [Kitasatospora cineracea]|uniref:HNH endonuclease signature motif containing protein n=1 Tax=Kitasatospora cineracea TaxID=88074 RepID=UPI0033F5673F